MKFHRNLLAAFTILFAASAAGQAPARRPGGFVPGQKRAPGDPVQIERGKAIYGTSCRGCHGADLRGGDLGGPNLLRSQVALSGRDGEMIVPIIQGARQKEGMPAIPMSPRDAHAVAAYVRSVLETIGVQGKPPSELPPPNILVGNAATGRRYFAAKCGSCHSATGDLRGLATRIADPKTLQNTWVAGAQRGLRGAPSAARTPAVTLTLPAGEKVQGLLVRMDDFLVTLFLPDGSERTFERNGDVPKVELHDPMQPHRDLLSVYTDKDMHDVTAYLVTLK